MGNDLAVRRCVTRHETRDQSHQSYRAHPSNSCAALTRLAAPLASARAEIAPYVEKGGVVAASEATGDTVGSTRTISVIGTDASFEEVLVLADAEKKAFAYSITDCAKTPFPLTTYGSKCYVMEDGEGCSVTWTGWYDVVEGTKDEEVPDFVGLYTGFINAAAEDARSA